MKRPRRSNAVIHTLYANAALLLAIFIVMIGRDHSIAVSPAYGQTRQPPIAGGGGIFVMPTQLHQNVWGCYLLDVDRQTLCVYEYEAGTSKSLVLKAARQIGYDLQLKDFNTSEHWWDVQKKVDDEKAQNQSRTSPATPANTVTPTNPTNP